MLDFGFFVWFVADIVFLLRRVERNGYRVLRRFVFLDVVIDIIELICLF